MALLEKNEVLILEQSYIGLCYDELTSYEKNVLFGQVCLDLECLIGDGILIGGTFSVERFDFFYKRLCHIRNEISAIFDVDFNCL